jgi:hypothetical protein
LGVNFTVVKISQLEQKNIAIIEDTITPDPIITRLKDEFNNNQIINRLMNIIM